jgi:hypothetical protein
MTPEPAIDSAEALCRKLERTFHRRPAYGDHQVDWVFDFAVTAWHLVDWIAEKKKANVKAIQAQLKEKCPALSVCEQICNGAKHFVLDNPQLKPFSVAKDVQCTDGSAGISRFNVAAGDKNVDIVLTKIVSITDKDGKSWQAMQLFLTILFFWQDELGLPRAS